MANAMCPHVFISLFPSPFCSSKTGKITVKYSWEQLFFSITILENFVTDFLFVTFYRNLAYLTELSSVNSSLT